MNRDLLRKIPIVDRDRGVIRFVEPHLVPPPLYRRATSDPGGLARPAVVQARPARSLWGTTLPVPHRARWWYVISPWPVPGRAPMIAGGSITIVDVETYAEAVALATAAARQHAEVTT